MPITATAKSTAPRQLPPAGTHVARCYQVIDLGSHDSEWQGKKRRKHSIRISWELPHELISEGEASGKPFAVHKSYSLSLSEKSTLRHDLQCWRGRAFTEEELAGFDLEKVLGVACMVTIQHDVKPTGTYANVAAVAAMPKGLPCPPAINAPLTYSINDHDEGVFSKLPDFMREQIQSSYEWKTRQFAGSQPEPDPEDQIPADEEASEDDIPF